MTKRLPSTIFLGLTSVAIVVIGAVAYYPRDPYLEADQMLVELGTNKQGVELQAEFHLRNLSGRPIVIVDVMTDCRCSKVDGFTRNLEKGDKTRLLIRIDTAGYRGELLKRVRVLYREVNSDAPLYRLTLAIRSDIVPEFTVEPSVLEFRAGVSSVQPTRLLAMRPGFRVESTDVTNNAFSVEKVNCQEHICILWIRFDPARWTRRRVPGDIPKIVIRTNSASEPVYYLDAKVVP